MDLYSFLVNAYNNFLSIFPPSIQWVVTLLVVVGLVAAFINLIRYNALFLILLVVLLPVLIPVFKHFFTDIYHFFLYLLQTLKITAPQS